MTDNKVFTTSNDAFMTNYDILIDMDYHESAFKWVDIEDVIKIYENLCGEYNVKPRILHTQLISDAIYEPIKDLADYNVRKHTFTRICHFVYLIGHSVGNCAIQLMIVLFVTLCTLNRIVHYPRLTDDIVDLFIRAYNKEIHMESFQNSLSNFLIKYYSNTGDIEDEYVDDDNISFVSQIDGGLSFSTLSALDE